MQTCIIRREGATKRKRQNGFYFSSLPAVTERATTAIESYTIEPRLCAPIYIYIHTVPFVFE